MPKWAKLLAPYAERVAHTLGKAMTGKYEPVTPLSGSHIRHAQVVVKAKKLVAQNISSSTTQRQRPVDPDTTSNFTCLTCGGEVSNSRHIRCESCIEDDPSQTPGIRKSRGRAIASRKAATAEWERLNRGVAYDPELFSREILPKLANVKLQRIVEVTGFSKSYAPTIRAGKWTPHISTWVASAKLVGVDTPKM